MGRLQERLKDYLNLTARGFGTQNDDKDSIEYSRERLEIDLETTQKSLDKLKQEFAEGASQDLDQSC